MFRSFDQNSVPDEVTLSDARRELVLCWRNGTELRFKAATLRTQCGCPECMIARASHSFFPMLDDIEIVGLQKIGYSAMNIAFSDGHARGIFPWTDLCRLARDMVPLPDRLPE